MNQTHLTVNIYNKYIENKQKKRKQKQTNQTINKNKTENKLTTTQAQQ